MAQRPNPDGVQAAYEAWAPTYVVDRNLTPFATAILRTLPFQLSGASVVEIGCGTGANTAWLVERAEHVMAFDLSSRMLEQALRRVTSDRVHFFQHDVSDPWPIPDQCVDLVLGSLVLEHIDDLAPVFHEAYRVLRSGGSFFACEFHPFRQLSGGRANFVDRSTGTPVYVPAVLHDVSDFINSGLTAGLTLTSLDEWRSPQASRDVAPIPLSANFLKR